MPPVPSSAAALLDTLFEHPAGVCSCCAAIDFSKPGGTNEGERGTPEYCSGVPSIMLRLVRCPFRNGSFPVPLYHG